MISLLVVTADGDMIETATVGREGAVGLQSGLGNRRSLTRATMQVPGKVAVVETPAFQAISRDNTTIHHLITRYTEIVWAEAQQVAACNAVHNASSRLCRWLLQTADRIESDELPLTQEFLAQMLGVRRTTVTLLAQELQKSEAIKYSRGRLKILDRKMLEDAACDCYGVLHQDRLPQKIGVSQ